MDVLTIKEVCERYQIGQTALARHFDIPLRTVQDWHSGRSKPPEYVVRMIVGLLERDAQDAPREDDKVFLIYWGNLDSYYELRGYIRGAEEDVAFYCEAYNETVKIPFEKAHYIELEQIN